jgi:hypothetical protein
MPNSSSSEALSPGIPNQKNDTKSKKKKSQIVWLIIHNTKCDSNELSSSMFSTLPMYNLQAWRKGKYVEQSEKI